MPYRIDALQHTENMHVATLVSSTRAVEGRTTKSEFAPDEHQAAKLRKLFEEDPNPSNYDEVLRKSGMPPTDEARAKVRKFYRNARYRNARRAVRKPM